MRKTTTAALSLLVAVGTSAQPLSESYILAPGDPTDALQFGDHVDIHDGIAIVSGLGLWTVPVPGAAYLFDAATGTQLAKLNTPELDGADQILYGAAIGPSRAMVATRNWTFTGTYTPRVWLFNTTDPANPVFMSHLQPSDAASLDDFGDDIAIDGSLALIGAPGNDGAASFSGAAYLFNTTTGAELGKVIASDGQSVDQFGWAVDLDNNTAIIGARWDDDSAPNGGAAYLFDVSDPANPVELAKLIAPIGDQNDYFGYSVAISGNLAAVGAMFDDDLGLDAGAVYIYDITNPASPVLTKKLLASDGNETDDFGWSVALEGTTLLACSRTDDDIHPGGGSAYLFDLADPSNPVELTKIVPSDTSANATFGWSCALEGTTAIIGASQSSAINQSQGQAYIVDIDLAPPCLADTNGDGIVSPADFSAWVAAFNAQAPECDQNGDGLCTPADFSAWVANYNNGC